MRTSLLTMTAAVCALAGCSSLSVDVDYDPQTRFSGMKSWAWFPDANPAATPDAPTAQATPLTVQRARPIVEQVLARKGFAKVAPEQADFLVAVHSVVERRFRTYSAGAGVGWSMGNHWGPYGPYGWGGYWDGYWGPPMVYAYFEVALMIDMIQPKPEKRLIWRGVARWASDADDTPKERETRVREAVEESLAKFPPGKGD